MDPRVRVGDADQEEIVAVLQQYATDGYLSLDEFSERSAAAYRAETRGELVALTADLPTRPAPARRGSGRWTPAAIVVAVLAGVVVIAAGAMILMMVMMSGTMGDMGDMGGM